MKNLFLFLIIVSQILLFTRSVMAEESQSRENKARNIMQKVYDREDGDNRISDMQMILIDKNGKKRIRELKGFSKDKGIDSLSLMFFTAPSDVKDTGFLSYDYDAAEQDDDQWLYLPALRKTKRIASGDKKGSFMGSDFSYGDMTKRSVSLYDYKILKEKKVRGHLTWVIEVVPKEQEIVDKYGYSKSVVFVRQDNYFTIQAVHWVVKGKKLKYMQVSKLDLIDNIWVATESTMTTKKGKKTLHKTILKYDNLKFNQDLKPDFFSVRQLEKGF